MHVCKQLFSHSMQLPTSGTCHWEDVLGYLIQSHSSPRQARSIWGTGRCPFSYFIIFTENKHFLKYQKKFDFWKLPPPLFVSVLTNYRVYYQNYRYIEELGIIGKMPPIIDYDFENWQYYLNFCVFLIYKFEFPLPYPHPDNPTPRIRSFIIGDFAY